MLLIRPQQLQSIRIHPNAGSSEAAKSLRAGTPHPALLRSGAVSRPHEWYCTRFMDHPVTERRFL